MRSGIEREFVRIRDQCQLAFEIVLRIVVRQSHGAAALYENVPASRAMFSARSQNNALGLRASEPSQVNENWQPVRRSEP